MEKATGNRPAARRTNGPTLPAAGRAVVGGGVGGALGVITVVMLPKLTSITWSAEEASLMTAALGVLFGWLVRFLPVAAFGRDGRPSEQAPGPEQ